MTEAEAREACARLAETDPDRATNQWHPRKEADGTWSVAKIGIPPTGPLTPETRADEKPATADDPRTAAMQNLGPHIGPGI
jgi:hypothetical protein